MPSGQPEKISLCLLVWNELAGCRQDVPHLPMDQFHECYVVDGGSTDGTVEFFQAQGIPLFRQPRKSLNAAYHCAVEHCTGDALVVFFPKGTLDPGCVLRLADRLRAGNGLVIASRNIPGGRNEEDDRLLKPRKWGVRLLAISAALLWRREGTWIRDILHGVKGFTIDAFRRMDISVTGVTIDFEMVVRAYRRRITRSEIPVHERNRLSGATHFPILPTAMRISRFIWMELFSRL